MNARYTWTARSGVVVESCVPRYDGGLWDHPVVGGFMSWSLWTRNIVKAFTRRK